MKLTHIFLDENKLDIAFLHLDKIIALGHYGDCCFNLLFQDELKTFGNAMQAFSYLNQEVQNVIPT